MQALASKAFVPRGGREKSQNDEAGLVSFRLSRLSSLTHHAESNIADLHSPASRIRPKKVGSFQEWRVFSLCHPESPLRYRSIRATYSHQPIGSTGVRDYTPPAFTLLTDSSIVDKVSLHHHGAQVKLIQVRRISNPPISSSKSVPGPVISPSGSSPTVDESWRSKRIREWLRRYRSGSLGSEWGLLPCARTGGMS